MVKSKLTYLTSDIDKKMCESIDDALDLKAYVNYRKQFGLASNFKKRFDFPVHVDIELTNTCNYQCSFCEHGRSLKDRKEYYKKRFVLPVAKVIRVLDQCSELGTKSIQFNIVNEPLLYPELLQVIDYAAKLKFPDVFFITNASLLNKPLSRKLIKSGLTKIMFSVDASSKDIYQRIRGKDAYQKILNNILDFLDLKKELKAKFPLSRVSFVATHDNSHQLKEFVKFWIAKVDSIAIQNLINLDGSIKSLRKGGYVAKKYRCNMPNFRLSIRADGRVNPCCVFYGDELVFGNIFQNSLADIWNSESFRRFQELHKSYKWRDNNVCNRCILSTNFSIKKEIN